MLRKTYGPGTAALLAAVLGAGAAGCTADGGTDDRAADPKAGKAPTPVAAPGKYRTLLEPCGAVDSASLKDLLPGLATLAPEQQRQAFQGTPAVTYNTDRRAACNWKGQAPDASHQLRVEFERVVSYDPAVSDEDRAQEVFAKKQAATSVPVRIEPEEPAGEETGGSPSATPGTGATPGVGTQAGQASGPPEGSGQPGGPGGSPSASASGEGLEPRVLSGLGDAAFIDDVLDTTRPTAQRRDVTPRSSTTCSTPPAPPPSAAT
ncbi:DUF3558 domain-containing protein [Streptomyces sp. t39]|uniref:DUF3558 domain-containing protein n=1 Tax=Streptomyces sp. t39 TaxID=1828156 RepID=UPI0011CE9317|nr:DUF3558 domain-containing protein [Streptomyces sp. t39]TXS56313.1 DUF3558 domain-containing protein [Streptomyces sp. t39]